MHVLGTLKSDTLWWTVIEEEGKYNKQMNCSEVFVLWRPKCSLTRELPEKKLNCNAACMGNLPPQRRLTQDKRCRIREHSHRNLHLKFHPLMWK